ncbi:MAG: CinA family protein [Candidatus Xenobia bacterium]
MKLEEAIGELLRARGLTLATAESCTGGLVADRLTDVSGSSDYFMGGAVTYSNASKTRWLQVPPAVFETQGAVSEACAKAMAEGALRAFDTNVAVATTGIAGPTGATPQKPVGLVYIAVAHGETTVRHQVHPGTRRQVKEAAAEAALTLLLEVLRGA